MLSHFAVILCLLSIHASFHTCLSQHSLTDIKSTNTCAIFNGSCSDCITKSQGECYYCGNECIEAGGITNFFSRCPLNEFYTGQCNLNLLGIIILSCLGFLCCCCYCGCCSVLICCCCCCSCCDSDDSSETYGFASRAARDTAKIAMLVAMNRH